MTQVVVNIEKPSVIAIFKKMVALMDGVSIAKPARPSAKAKERKCGLDLALEDVREGRINTFDSVEDMMKDLMSEE